RHQHNSKPLSDISQNSFHSMIDVFKEMCRSDYSGLQICDIFKVLQLAIKDILVSCNISPTHRQYGKIYQFFDEKALIKEDRHPMFGGESLYALDRQFLIVCKLIGFLCKLKSKMDTPEWSVFESLISQFIQCDPRSTSSFSLLHFVCTQASNEHF